MNPIKITRTFSKKSAWKALGKTAFMGFALYGVVAGTNNFSAFSHKTYEDFIFAQARARNLVEEKTVTQLVIDPQKQAAAIDAAAEKVSSAATEGAKKGAQAQIDKALQGK